IDTNIPSGPPTTGCWWDPWWGYVCYSSYPTETTDAFSYQALLGIRYEFDNDRTFLRLGYTSQWMSFSSASGTPRFDVVVLDIGWMF
ncbi:MAG: porin family protein, partial [Acidobacteria bacterium]|nr:porin family protein [Candidatus Sulfomarinibacter kjeldsenii]